MLDLLGSEDVSRATTEDLLDFVDGMVGADKSVKGFIETWDKVSDPVEAYRTYIKESTDSTSKFAASLKTAAANFGIMLAASVAIKLVTAAWDNFNTTVQEVENDLAKTQGTIASLKTQIEELEKIDANALTQGQKDKLENLKEQLKVQEQLEQVEKRRLARETVGSGNFADYFDKDSYKYAYNNLMNDLSTYYDKFYGSGLNNLYKERTSEVERTESNLYTAKKRGNVITGYENQFRRATRKQEKSREDILELQDGLVSNKADILSWISTIEGYIEDGSLVGSDLTDANKNLNDLKARLEYINSELHYINTLLYGGDDSWENVLLEKTQYSLENLRDYGFTDNELEVLATLEFDKTASLKELREILDESQKVVKENPPETEVKFSKSKMIDSINSMSDGFDILDTIYADVFDKESFDFTNLDSKKFEEAFKGLDDEYANFIETVSSSPNDIKACQEAFNELASAYIDNKGILKGLTEENANVAASMLKNMGIANAEEIVMMHLNGTVADLAAYKQFATEKGYELANATYAEASEFINEAECSAIAKQELAQLALEKININENKINTASDIEHILTLADAAKAGSAELAQLARAKSVLFSVENAGGDIRKAGVTSWEYNEALAIIDDINSGKFDYNFSPIDRSQFSVSDYGVNPKYTGGDATKSAKDAAADAAEKAKEEFDFFERRVKNLEDAFNSLEQSIENVVGSFAKNKLVDAQLDILDQEFSDYTEAIDMYQDKANEFLAKIPEGMRDKVVNGDISVATISDENLKEAINDYQTWADKVSECTQKLEELKTQLRELELQKFNNIVEDFTNQFDLFGSGKDLIDGQISLLEESGELIGRGYYDSQIDLTGKQLETLEAQKAAMVKQMADAIDSGRIQYGTAEWLEMVNAITEVDASILECKTDIEGFENAILELEWANFERLNTEFDNINDELSNLVTLLNDYTDIEVSDGEGNWTDKAITALGLYTQQYELAKHRVAEYSEQLEKLEDDYAAGKYSTTEYLEKLAELKQGQYDAVNAAEDMEDAIISLNETRINEEIETINEQIEAYKEVVDAQLEAIETSEKLADRQEDLADKAKSVADIEKKLAALQNDTTAAAIAERKQLEEDLYNAKKELSDAEHDYSIEDQKDALNKQYENFEKEKQDEIEALEESLKEREALLQQSFETVKANTDLIAQELLILAQDHGIKVSDAITTAWTKGENSIASYGEALTAGTSAFIANLDTIELELYGLQTKADETSVSIANMFGQRADNLVQQLTDAYNSEANLQNMSDALASGLNNLASGFDNMAYSAGKAADEVNKLKDALNNPGGTTPPKEYSYPYGTGNPYQNVDEHADHIGAADPSFRVYGVYDKVAQKNIYFDSKKEADKFLQNNNVGGRYIKQYRRGSKRIDEDQLAWTDEYGQREMIIRRSDGAILTRLEKGDAVANANLAENLFKWGAINPNSFMQNIGNMGTYKVVDVQPNDSQRNVVLNIAKMNEFNGDFNGTEQLLGMMNKVATNSTTKILNDINRSFRTSGR